ncbi:FAD/NAD(P)-binding domain-containing protein [Suillus ampliporus]|nr:FAD/NAD(P)-binding domain-containing protein [Suillus ampliporus]
MSSISHFLSDGWFRDLLCFSWNFRTLSGPENIHRFLSEIVDGKSRLECSGLRDFKLDDHTVNAPSPFKLPGPQVIEGVQGAFTFSITNPPALGRGFFRLTQDIDRKWKALTLFTNMQDLIGYEESSTDRQGLYEGRKTTWEEDVDAKFRAIEVDHTVDWCAVSLINFGGGQSGLMCAVRLGRLGIHALVIEKNARVADSWRQRYPNLTLHTPTYQSSILYSPYPTNFPKDIAKGKLTNFLDSYAVNQELCIWLSSIVDSTPVCDSSSARWTVEVQHGDQKVVILNPKHLVLAARSGRPRIPSWNGMEDFQGALYHSDFHTDAEQFRGKRVVVVGAVSPMCAFIACVYSRDPHGAAEVRNLPFSDNTPIEELDLRMNSLPSAFLLQLMKSGRTQHVKIFDKELHDGLRKAGFNLTWEISPGSGEVGLAGFLFCRLTAGTSKLIVEGKVKVKQGQDINQFHKDGIEFKDGSKLLQMTGNEPVMKATRAFLGDKIAEQLLPEVWGLDSEVRT